LSAPIRPLTFLAQLKLAEFFAITDEIGLPDDGRLLFFFDTGDYVSGFDPASRGSVRVLFVPDGKPSSLRRPPPRMPDVSSLHPCALNLSLEQTLPNDARWYGVDLHVWNDQSPYTPLIRDLTGEDKCIHRAGGFPEAVQNAMELECQLVTNGISCGDSGGYNDPRRAALEPGAADWRLLLQLDSDEHTEWMWGDVGRLYFWIRQQDLADQNFGHIWCIQQCY
jgi:uncharacterized protein YwqG